jgi:CPA2 family monovalent cation:H+ antiporter-2
MLAVNDQANAFVISLLVILSTSAIVAIVMQRMRLAVIPAYLIAGVIIGPGTLGLVRSDENLQAIADLAVVLLMFGIGMHLHLSVFGHSLGRMVTAGVVSWLASTLVGWPVAQLFGLHPAAGLTLCMALSMSSTAVVLRVIAERGELRHNSGRLALAILVVQDLMVILVMASLPILSKWAGVPSESVVDELDHQDLPRWLDYFVDAALSVGVICAMIVAGKIALPRLLREAARETSGEVMMIVSIAVAIGAGLVTQVMGFSMELGAFMAGFLLSATPFRHQLSGQIAPLRDLFMAVFFTSLGSRLDPQAVVDWWWVVLIGGAAMSVIKAATIGVSCWAIGATPAVAVRVALALAQAGEFSLVLIGVAEDRAIFNATVTENSIAIVVISLMITPFMVDVGRWWSERWRRVECAPWIRHSFAEVGQAAVPPREGRFVIVGGYGQVGRAIGRALDEAHISYSVVEIRADTARQVAAQGREVVYGDVANPEVLESAGLEFADALVLTMPDEPSVLRACAEARRRRAGIFIAVRIGIAGHGRIASELGADAVIVEETEAAKALQSALVEHFKGTNPPDLSLK